VHTSYQMGGHYTLYRQDPGFYHSLPNYRETFRDENGRSAELTSTRCFMANADTHHCFTGAVFKAAGERSLKAKWRSLCGGPMLTGDPTAQKSSLLSN
jgi:hypothetical protein